jgi:dephospho-CoA kinase
MLEAITHPPIRRKISQELDQGINDQTIPWIVLDVSLLLESGWDRSCDEIWFIDTPEDQRLQRALQRGWTQEDFHAREASQWSLQRKRSKATRTLWNGSTIEQLKALVLDAVRVSSQP